MRLYLLSYVYLFDRYSISKLDPQHRLSIAAYVVPILFDFFINIRVFALYGMTGSTHSLKSLRFRRTGSSDLNDSLRLPNSSHTKPIRMQIL